MSWRSPMEFNYTNNNFPYNSAGSFVNFVEGLAYEHANFIFPDALHAQEEEEERIYKSCWLYEPGTGSVSYYNHYDISCYSPVLNITEYYRDLATITNGQTSQENSIIDTNFYYVECPQDDPDVPDHHQMQVVRQDDVDPDNMSYEELIELGETVGTENRGLPQDIISTLPVGKFKCGFFSRKKTRYERCVICQMEYKRGERQIILSCKHVYHVSCGTKWLSINKACPICYTDVFADVALSKQ